MSRIVDRSQGSWIGVKDHGSVSRIMDQCQRSWIAVKDHGSKSRIVGPSQGLWVSAKDDGSVLRLTLSLNLNLTLTLSEATRLTGNSSKHRCWLLSLPINPMWHIKHSAVATFK